MNDDSWLDDEPDCDDPEWEEDEDEFFDCHMDRSGQCGMAGSEECEFECPVMAAVIRRERAKAKK